MTTVYYPNRDARSPDGRFLLEGRSPHNGTIAHRDGTSAEGEFGFTYREHQSGFRYRLLDTFRRGSARVVWERWQDGPENSAHELHASDHGWSVIRTHGMRPEVIAVNPAGQDAVRVRVFGPLDADSDSDSDADSPSRDQAAARRVPIQTWTARHLQYTTAGYYWSLFSWPYFLRSGSIDYFVWRTFWGQRLVINLTAGKVLPEDKVQPAELAQAMDLEERRGATELLTDVTAQLPEVQAVLAREPGGKEPTGEEKALKERAWERAWRAVAAIQVLGAHRVAECLSLLRKWEPVECLAYTTRSNAMTEGWHLSAQLIRPAVHHALKHLGEQPGGYPVYRFARGLSRHEEIPLPTPPPDRDGILARLPPGAAARRVLEQAGSPDHIRRASHLVEGSYQWTEDWEYDSFKDGKWSTLRITWRERPRRPRIEKVEQVDAYWLDTDKRLVELPCFR